MRFIEIAHGNWDQHRNLNSALTRNCRATDQPLAALLRDLKERGLLDETLVVWGGEFGRTSDSQGSDGRDHNPNAFTTWLAGGGVKGGAQYGSLSLLTRKVVQAFSEYNDFHRHYLSVIRWLGFSKTEITVKHEERFSGKTSYSIKKLIIYMKH